MDDWWVVCLCAGWCGVCREYRAIFDALARSQPGVRFEWVDVEDDDEIVGDLDVETFPTLLIAGGGQARFMGPLAPQGAVLERLIGSLQAEQPPGATLAAPVAQQVWANLRKCRS